MLQEPRLHAPAFATINVAMTYEWPYDWHVKITGRREGAGGFEHDSYTDLLAEDVLEVLVNAVGGMLGI